MNTDSKQIIQDFMNNTTVEVTPNGAKKVADFRSILNKGSTVYVTFLPGSDFKDTVSTVKRLKSEGFNPVPHFAARSIPNKAFLETNLELLEGETGVTEGLLIGGGVDVPVGDFSSSIEVLETGLFEKYGFKKIGLAGHPEGSPDISDKDCNQAIVLKNSYAKSSSISFYLATQFVFEAAPVIAWEELIRTKYGNELPVHIGIPGLATVKSLLRHSKACGVGASMRFLTRNPMTMVRLFLKDSFLKSFVNAPSSAPGKLVYDLSHSIYGSNSLIKQVHLYPLGGLKKSVDWLYKIQNGDFTVLNGDIVVKG